MTMTPDEWLADFESKVVDMQHKAAAFRRKMEQAGKTLKSADGRLEITVGPNGALLGLKITDDDELAKRIMQLARKAREAAAEEVNDSFRPLAGGHVDQFDEDTEPAEPDAADEPEPKPTKLSTVDEEESFEHLDFSDPSMYEPDQST